MSDSHRIGIIIGQVSTSEFYFATNSDINKLEYITLSSIELVENEDSELVETDVHIIAQIFQVWSASRALVEDLKIEDAEKIIQAGLADARYFAKARILGYLHNGDVYQPRRAVRPGNSVYLAPNELLQRFYSYPEEEGLFIGHLITRSDVPVNITINGFRRHASILAQTGGGKSYLAGVLAEELHEKGATIVMIDPHADYVFLGRTLEERNIERVDIFRTQESTGRYTDAEIGRMIQTYQVRFSDLTQEEIEIVCGIQPRWANIQAALETALDNLHQGTRINPERDDVDPNAYTLQDLLDELEDMSTPHSRNARRYVRRLRNIRIFGDATTDISRIIRPQHISVIDLSGLTDNVADYVNYRILSETYEQLRNRQYHYPVFLFIEEAHRYIPARDNTLTKLKIKEIASEGRKFGIFLILITQRPYKIDQDALSQCNSQFILRITNPEDQNAISASSEKLSSNLLQDLPGLNRGEAIIVGNLTRAPVMIKVRRRRTREGGSDIDVIGRLREARQEAENEAEDNTERAREELRQMRED